MFVETLLGSSTGHTHVSAVALINLGPSLAYCCRADRAAFREHSTLSPGLTHTHFDHIDILSFSSPMARINTRRETSTATSLYRSRTPNSDKENHHSQQTGKRKSMNPPPTRPPLSASEVNKRRRLDTPQTRIESILSQHPRKEHNDETTFFDPEQDEELRRDIRLAIRDNHRDIHG